MQHYSGNVTLHQQVYMPTFRPRDSAAVAAGGKPSASKLAQDAVSQVGRVETLGYLCHLVNIHHCHILVNKSGDRYGSISMDDLQGRISDLRPKRDAVTTASEVVLDMKIATINKGNKRTAPVKDKKRARMLSSYSQRSLQQVERGFRIHSSWPYSQHQNVLQKCG